jgi:flagellar motor protein MotB
MKKPELFILLAALLAIVPSATLTVLASVDESVADKLANINEGTDSGDDDEEDDDEDNEDQDEGVSNKLANDEHAPVTETPRIEQQQQNNSQPILQGQQNSPPVRQTGAGLLDQCLRSSFSVSQCNNTYR